MVIKEKTKDGEVVLFDVEQIVSVKTAKNKVLVLLKGCNNPIPIKKDPEMMQKIW